MQTGLSKKEIFFLNIQIFLDHVMMFFMGHIIIFILKYVRGHTFENHQENRRRFRALVREKRPMVICANHLTMVDSILIHHATNSVLGFVANFRTFSWNIPAIENFSNSLIFRLVTYFGGCIPIDRDADASHHTLVLNKLRYLLQRGYVVTMFPEGTRSRTGRIDPEKVTYGVGNILKDLSDYRVLCVYLRGENQETYSDFPKKGDRMYFRMEVFEPKSESTGMRAARDLSRQIILKLKEMEDTYFSEHGMAKS